MQEPLDERRTPSVRNVSPQRVLRQHRSQKDLGNSGDLFCEAGSFLAILAPGEVNGHEISKMVDSRSTEAALDANYGRKGPRDQGFWLGHTDIHVPVSMAMAASGTITVQWLMLSVQYDDCDLSTSQKLRCLGKQ